MTDLEFDNFLRSYLTAEKARDVYESLKGFPDNLHKIYFHSTTRAYLLQGDCYKQLPAPRIIESSDGELSAKIEMVKAVILNNSCDMSEGRDGGEKVDLMYCPLLSLNKYLGILREKRNKTDSEIKSIESSIKRQELSNIMYLPPFRQDVDDMILFFDKIYSCPIGIAKKHASEPVFYLSNYGFYAFIYKMSVHFLRMREKEDRDKTA